MDASKLAVVNDLHETGAITDGQYADIISRIEPTDAQAAAEQKLAELHAAGIIFDDEHETFRGRLLNTHLVR